MRNSPYARCLEQNNRKVYDWIYKEDMLFRWKYARPQNVDSLRIYEAHIGICTPEQRVSTFVDFRVTCLPRIKASGYTAIQLMAIAEHAYYGSFGYQVTGSYAASSRFGTANELKQLIDEAHGMGLLVLIDIVHAHASSNCEDGLNGLTSASFKTQDYFVEGKHPLWDSRCFAYGKLPVLRFLLGNLAYWLEEFKVDGFRFDGVTSMLYVDHAATRSFSGDYAEYYAQPHTAKDMACFGGVNIDACVYLMLAQLLIKQINPDAICIAEDVSGMPGMCRHVLEEAGFGFDYRLAMALPDVWIKVLKEYSDGAWPIDSLCHTLSNRRWQEPVVAYAESHDQALVGDKTLAFRLMDSEMYTKMSLIACPLTSVIDRGMSLHKMIRFSIIKKFNLRLFPT